MKLQLNLTPKLTLVFVLFAAVLVAGVGGLAYENGRAALEAATVSELLAMAIEKQAALNGWVEERQSDIAALANSPNLLDTMATFAAAAPNSAAVQVAHDRLVAELRPRTGSGQEYLGLLVIEPETGQVIAATDAREEGKFREDQSYFINGENGPYVQNPYYSPGSQGPAMTVAAPLRAADGRLLAVLVGHLNLAEMNAMINRRTGLHQSADAYLVNTSHLFVTQPRFVSDPAVLQRGVHTEAVRRCLARNSGVVSAADYRGVPAISVYRWLPERQLCLVAEMDQVEAFAPARALGETILLIGGLALMVASALAVGLARTIAGPVRQLVKGAAEIGRGNLEYRIAVGAQDEIGRLAGAFNAMAANLRQSLGETAHGQRLLLALSQAAQTVQRAHTPEEVYRTVGDEVAGLGYNSSVFTLTEDRAHLAITHLNLQPGLQRAAEKLTGLSAQDFRFPLVPDGFYQRILAGGETTFSERFAEPIAEALPWPVRPLAGRVAALLGLEQGIVAPLTVGGETVGLLTVSGTGLTEADVPAVTAFANQTAIALENAMRRCA